MSSDYVKLTSADGYSFTISREAAMVSGTLKTMLGSTFQESQTNSVNLQEITGVVLEKVCEYLCYNVKNRDNPAAPDFEVPPEMALELLMAADFLDGKYSSWIGISG